MQLILYTTDHCQLCESAEALIYTSLAGWEYELQKVDISEQDQLLARYALRIPVLSVPGHCKSEELDWPFDADRLITFLTESRATNDAI